MAKIGEWGRMVGKGVAEFPHLRKSAKSAVQPSAPLPDKIKSRCAHSVARPGRLRWRRKWQDRPGPGRKKQNRGAQSPRATRLRPPRTVPTAAPLRRLLSVQFWRTCTTLFALRGVIWPRIDERRRVRPSGPHQCGSLSLRSNGTVLPHLWLTHRAADIRTRAPGHRRKPRSRPCPRTRRPSYLPRCPTLQSGRRGRQLRRTARRSLPDPSRSRAPAAQSGANGAPSFGS
jgi:hypothetical protein